MSNNLGKEMNILVVEDNELIVESLEYILKKEGYTVFLAKTKKDAIWNINNHQFNLILLDVQLPDGTGFEICKHIKEISDIPIIFLTGRGEESNIVYGLDIGADDYIIKPFGNNELLSRINSVLRRYMKKSYQSNEINYRNLKIDIEKAEVYKDNEHIYLTNLEYKILLLFLNNKNKLVTRERILEKIWDVEGNYVNDNTLSVYIKRLRLKIGDTGENQMIKTVRGIGYMLNS